MESTTIFTLAITLFLAIYSVQHVQATDGWELRILHTNDMHSRFSQTSASSTECLPKQARSQKCYGGFARLVSLIRNKKNSTIPTIFLNAGDTYSGTKWFTAHNWTIVSALLNMLEPDVVSLGNHEFDKGIDLLIPYINAARFPIVTANLDLKGEPKLAATKLQKSHILKVAGNEIGVIGYLTPETKLISATGKVIFLDEIESIRMEVAKLQKAGVKILIALGHSGFEVDKKIAAEVDGLDLVIGAHDNTFLYNGPQPDREIPVGPYPTPIVGIKNRTVYVVQAYAYTKYLGDLMIKFDAEGEIQKIGGNPILLDKRIPEATDVLEELLKWEPAVIALNRRPVGSTRVFLDGTRNKCRRGECNLGNLIVDAMIDYNLADYAGSPGWTDAAIAMLISGTIQASIDKLHNQNITAGDVIEVLPFSNGMVKMDLTGKVIVEMLEHSVNRLMHSLDDLSGAFLQFSGLQVIYDLSKPYGERVKEVLVRCANCTIPTFVGLDQGENYKILTTDFVANGGEGYSMLSKIGSVSMGAAIDEILIRYLMAKSPVHPEIEGRINFLYPELLDNNAMGVIGINSTTAP